MNGWEVAITAAIAFLIAAVAGVIFVPFLKKLKYGQPIIEEYGPTWHKSKSGTPTMGGFIFILATCIASALGFILFWLDNPDINRSIMRGEIIYFVSGLLMALAYGFLGFVDDYIKVVKKRNLGLTAKQKILMQLLIGVLYLAALAFFKVDSTVLWIPFIGSFDIGFFYYPLALFIIVGFVNAVNLTDGIDGLASSVTFVVSVSVMIISSLLNLMTPSILSTALAAALIGFLIYNFHPAKVFMGDTGSLFLGGMLIAFVFSMRMPLLVVLLGIVYLLETLSVIIQVTYFKITGKRLFKMSPIHHHFEMSGYSEVKIVALFSAVACIGCIAAIAAVVMR